MFSWDGKWLQAELLNYDFVEFRFENTFFKGYFITLISVNWNRAHEGLWQLPLHVNATKLVAIGILTRREIQKFWTKKGQNVYGR